MVNSQWQMATAKRPQRSPVCKALLLARCSLLLPSLALCSWLLGLRKRPAKVVRITSGDPVAFGFAVSLAQPGGNITGAGNSVRNGRTGLKETLSPIQRLAVLFNPTNFHRRPEPSGNGPGSEVDQDRASAIRSEQSRRIEKRFFSDDQATCLRHSRFVGLRYRQTTKK